MAGRAGTGQFGPKSAGQLLHKLMTFIESSIGDPKMEYKGFSFPSFAGKIM